jgi:hypothetical protein
MAQKEEAEEFYERVLGGSDYSKTITLEHNSGAELEDVQMTAVSKGDIGDAVSDMPDEMFEAAEDEDVSAEEAQELAEEQASGGAGAINKQVVQGFEELCNKSLEHPQLSPSQMEQIVGELNFETLFELGSEILSVSIEESGDVQGFREQS